MTSDAATSEPKPPAKARLAATILLLRETGGGMELFMVVRHHEIDFASGALVFPGGSVEPGDRSLAAEAELLTGAAGLDEATLALRIAAVRETFEECGILLARPRGSEHVVDAVRLAGLEAVHRAALSAGTLAFADFVAREKLVLALDLLVPFAHWITPLKMPKRFDTHFFLTVAPSDQVGTHDGREAVDSVWIAPRRALEEAKAGRYKILFPTERNLIRLARATTAAEAIAAARTESIVTVMPELTRTADGRRQLRIPANAGYDGEVFDVDF